MPKFKITVSSHYTTKITVDAPSIEEAVNKIQDQIDGGTFQPTFATDLTMQEVVDGQKVEEPVDPKETYFKFLERLRRSGVTNMFGAGPYLEKAYGLSRREASAILSEWMQRYDELSEKYGWRN